jgi:hypothetical protein
VGGSESRRFPPPWSIDALVACFVVIDSAGQKLAYVYFARRASEIVRRLTGKLDERTFKNCLTDLEFNADALPTFATLATRPWPLPATRPQLTAGHASRRFPPPWTVEELDACFVVRDHNAQARSPMSISKMSWGGDQRPSRSAKMRREGSSRTSEVTLVTARTCAARYPVMEGDCDYRKGDLPMSTIHEVHAEKIVPMPRLRQLHAERIVLLPLLAGIIAAIICLGGALNRIPGGEPPPAADDHAAHQPLRGNG